MSSLALPKQFQFYPQKQRHDYDYAKYAQAVAEQLQNKIFGFDCKAPLQLTEEQKKAIDKAANSEERFWLGIHYVTVKQSDETTFVKIIQAVVRAAWPQEKCVPADATFCLTPKQFRTLIKIARIVFPPKDTSIQALADSHVLPDRFLNERIDSRTITDLGKKFSALSAPRKKLNTLAAAKNVSYGFLLESLAADTREAKEVHEALLLSQDVSRRVTKAYVVTHLQAPDEKGVVPFIAMNVEAYSQAYADGLPPPRTDFGRRLKAEVDRLGIAPGQEKLFAERVKSVREETRNKRPTSKTLNEALECLPLEKTLRERCVEELRNADLASWLAGIEDLTLLAYAAAFNAWVDPKKGPFANRENFQRVYPDKRNEDEIHDFIVAQCRHSAEVLAPEARYVDETLARMMARALASEASAVNVHL